MAFPEQRYIGLLIIAIAVIIFLFNIKIEDNKLKIDSQWVKRRRMLLILGMISSGTIFIACGIAFFLKPPAEVSDPLDNTILVDCTNSKMPAVVPPSGMINMLQFSPAEGILRLSTRTGTPGKKWNDWPDHDKSINAYRCKVTSNKEMVSQLRIEFPIYFSEGEKNGGGFTYNPQNAKHVTQCRIYIPVLNPNMSEAFEFYIYNGSHYGVSAMMPKTASIQQKEGEPPRIVKLIPSALSGFPIFFPPVKWPVK